MSENFILKSDSYKFGHGPMYSNNTKKEKEALRQKLRLHFYRILCTVISTRLFNRIKKRLRITPQYNAPLILRNINIYR